MDDPGFAEAYQRAAHVAAPRSRASRGTLAWLVADYRASSAYQAIKSTVTKRNYARYLDMIATEDGHRNIAGCRRPDIRRMRDRMQAKPGKANNWLNVFRTIMSYAVDAEMRADNPAVGIAPLPIGQREPWPADVLRSALAAATPMLRLALVTGLCSGVRVGDVIRMQHGWHDGAMMEMRVTKNATDVAIPMHPLWLSELAAMPRRSVTILYERSGKPFSSPKVIQARVRALLKQIGESGNYTFHGLRKNAACYIVEAGMSESAACKVLAMTPETLRHYTKRANALMLVRSEASKITGGDVLGFTRGRAKGGAE